MNFPRVAAVQIGLSSTTEAAFEHANDLLDQHAEQLKDIDLIAFPDHWLIPQGRKEMVNSVASVPGKISECVSELARQRQAYVAFTTFERGEDKPFNFFGFDLPYRVYRTSVLVGRTGEIVGKHRRSHYLAAECPGEDASVFATDFGKVGLASCGEALATELLRVYMLADMDLLVWMGGDFRLDQHEALVRRMPVPESTLATLGLKRPQLDDLLVKTLKFAVELSGPDMACFLSLVACSYILYVNNVGTHYFAEFVKEYFDGDSCLVGLGEILARGGDEETVLVAELEDLEGIRRFRRVMTCSRQPQLYESLVAPIAEPDGVTFGDLQAVPFQPLSGERQVREQTQSDASNERQTRS